MKPKSSWSAAFRAAFPHALPEAVDLPRGACGRGRSLF